MIRRHTSLVVLVLLALPVLVFAQTGDDQGRVWGDYTTHFSMELGGRIADNSGSDQMYSTLVDLQSGPRLLSQELTMQSISHEGLLFDNLYMSSFGFGGDPNSLARLRLQKNRWYNFVGQYRRDKNVFDYDLFANPMNLNQGITTCGTTCTNAFDPTTLPWFSNSTRLMNMTRNMGDFSLTLLPESSVSVRLGYARNASYGLLSTTLEAPIRSLLAEDSQWRSDRYQFGVDFKVLPRTTISADVFLEHDKNDLSFQDFPSTLYTLGNATGSQILFNGQPLPLDAGILLPPLGGTLPSCATAGVQTIFPGSVFLLNSGCSGVMLNTGIGGSYFRVGNVRTDIPTGQLSFQSGYFRNLDIVASATYSSATSDFLNFNEFAHLNSNQPGAPAAGTVSTTNSNLFLINGSPTADHITANADLGATYHVSKSISVSDKFRWVNWRQSGGDTETRYGCFLPSGTNFATAAGTAGTFTSLLNPCFSGILDLINPAGGGLIGTAGNVGAGRGNYQQNNFVGTLIGERSYFNTFKVNWQPSRHFGGYVGYRFARRSLQDGNLDITGILSEITSNFVNNGLGTPPTTPTCNATTTGCDTGTGIITNVGGVDSSQLNQHTALLGVNFRPVNPWHINADLELLYADNFFTNISPRHQQRIRVYSTYKVRPWLSFNGGVHFVESRNDFAASEFIEDTSTLLFPNTLPNAYGHKDHWRYYTLGTTATHGRFTFDLGWTLLDQNIESATCMPITSTTNTGASNGVFSTDTPSSGPPATAPATCNPIPPATSTNWRALVLNYQETTNSGYFNVSFQPVKRVTLSLGYNITGDNGQTIWTRLDNGQPLMVVGDVFGNSPPLSPAFGGGNAITPCPGASVSTGCVFVGPFPDQPLGPQASNWHQAHFGVGIEVVRGVQFNGMWNYYDYNSKDEVPSLSLLRVLAPRDFHANVGTLSLKYSF